MRQHVEQYPSVGSSVEVSGAGPERQTRAACAHETPHVTSRHVAPGGARTGRQRGAARGPPGAAAVPAQAFLYRDILDSFLRL